MSTLVAIDIADEEATLVTAEASPNGIELLGVKSLLFSEVFDRTEVPDQSDGEVESSDAAAAPMRVDLSELVYADVDSSLAVIPNGSVLYQDVLLPFNDPKKIDQVAPLQIQDLVPFDLDSFVLDNVVVNHQPEGAFDIISSMVPAEKVAETLSKLSLLGADPRIVSTKASALSALVRLSPEKFEGTFGLVAFCKRTCAVALFVDGELRRLRELTVSAEGDGGDILADIRCSLVYLQREISAQVEALYVVGSQERVRELRDGLLVPVMKLDLSTLVGAERVDKNSLEEISWAVGLFANELYRKKDAPLVDFRRGPFAYKPAWQNFMLSLKEELFYVVAALLCGLVWVGSLLYLSHSSLSKVEAAISEGVSRALEGESVPYRREVAFFEQKIAQIENQLREMGTLSSLSPLEALKEIAAGVDPTLQMEIDSITIRHSLIDFSGSVVDNPAIGRLHKLLEARKDRFCKVKVDPGPRVRGESRVNFDAEIKLCE